MRTREINGTSFSLCGIDTGVLSRVLKDMEFRKRYFSWTWDQEAIPAVSIWNVLELRKKKELYREFVQLFGAVPFAMLKSPLQLQEEERSSYPKPEQISPVVYYFTPFAEKRSDKLGAFLPKLFKNPGVKKSERLWKTQWRHETLESMLALKKNFPPRGSRYTAADGRRFIEEGVPQHVISQSPRWAKGVIGRGGGLNPDAFPSLKIGFYTVFCRFYAEQREPEIQDVFDILIAGPTPYLDGVITENFQAEIYRKTRKRDSLLDGIEIFTMRDLKRKWFGFGRVNAG